jgi:diguanylate cyclase (GGDEF)-like protein
MNDTMESKSEVSKLEEIMSKLSPDERAFVSGLIDKDPLTGLYNRRKFDQDIELVVSMSGRGNKGSGLLFIDIDHFKKFNDKYGHQRGDQVLREITQSIEQNLRDYDKIHIYRYGGEEFVIIVSDVSIKDTFQIGDRLRKAVKESSGLTISIGISHYKEISGDLQSLINNADNALLEAKRKGRDSVVIYGKTS